MIITRHSQMYPVQYGLGVKFRRDLRGGNLFSTIRRYGLPAGKFVWQKILRPFLKNNKRELTAESMNIIKKLAAGKKPDIKEAAREIIQSKSLAEHLRGEGIK